MRSDHLSKHLKTHQARRIAQAAQQQQIQIQTTPQQQPQQLNQNDVTNNMTTTTAPATTTLIITSNNIGSLNDQVKSSANWRILIILGVDAFSFYLFFVHYYSIYFCNDHYFISYFIYASRCDWFFHSISFLSLFSN